MHSGVTGCDLSCDVRRVFSQAEHEKLSTWQVTLPNRVTFFTAQSASCKWTLPAVCIRLCPLDSLCLGGLFMRCASS